MGQVVPLRPCATQHPRIVFGQALTRRLTKRASELTGISFEDLIGPTHPLDIAYARFAVMLVAYENGKSYPQIGRVLNRHHTTVMDGAHRALDLEATDEDFAHLVHLLREEAAR